jgi:PKD repeat protein
MKRRMDGTAVAVGGRNLVLAGARAWLLLGLLAGCTHAPKADFSASKTSGAPPLEVQFTSLSTGEVQSWLWNFGDGSGSALENPTHFYGQPGKYTVQLTVVGPTGADSETKQSFISVGSLTADFGADQTSGEPPLVVAFQDLSQGGATSWAWDFGDGGTSTQQNPSHSYATAGVFAVSLSVRGPDGTDTMMKPDFVRVGGLAAEFMAEDTLGDAPLQVAYTDLSTGEISAWNWNFGDGGTSAEQNPVHTYMEPGEYTVSLTVRSAGGDDTITKDGYVRALDADAVGIWTSARELETEPMSGAAWNNVISEANTSTGQPDVSNQDDNTDVRVMAKALVYARTGQETYRTQVIDACMAAIGTEVGGRTLALGRNLIGYVIAADLVGLPAQEDARFRDWLRTCLSETLDGRTLRSTHEDRPNNWGTHAGASRAAAAAYLGDQPELDRCAQVFKGYLGDRSSYAGFTYGSLSWQADPSKPVGINPKGATRDGHSIDGVLTDDQRRAGDFTWPPPKENYAWEGLQGAVAQALVLHRAGYDVWEWEDQALLRAVTWLHEQCNFPAEGDDTWQPHVVNFFYGSDFPAPVPSRHGKNVGWTDWTHSK